MNAPDVLDCGHAPTANTGCGTGYGVAPDGTRHCYACCAERERSSMVANGRATLYLCDVASGEPVQGYSRDRARVTDWPGVLSFEVTALRSSPRGGGFGSQRTDAWFIGPDGFIWHAVNRGDMQIARCRRTKQRCLPSAGMR